MQNIKRHNPKLSFDQCRMKSHEGDPQTFITQEKLRRHESRSGCQQETESVTIAIKIVKLRSKSEKNMNMKTDCLFNWFMKVRAIPQKLKPRHVIAADWRKVVGSDFSGA